MGIAPGLQLTTEDEVAVLAGDRHQFRVDPEDLPHQTGLELLDDLGIRTGEGLEDVGPAHDANQGAVFVDHGHPFDPFAVHETGRIGMVAVSGEGEDRPGHDIADQPLRVRLRFGVQPAKQTCPLPGAPPGLFLDEVGFCDHADEGTGIVSDGETADPGLDHSSCCLLEGGIRSDCDDVGSHQILESHVNLLFRDDPAS